MKAIKWIIGGATLVSFVSVFLDWVSVQGATQELGELLPTSGMDNGGPVFLFFMGLVALAVLIGVITRFGRGLAVLSLVGSLLASFMALVKFADIEEATTLLADKVAGLSVAAGAGYWLFFGAASLTLVASIVALIKPEPKPTPAPAPLPAGPPMAPVPGPWQ